MSATLSDLIITCVDCGESFVFTVAEQLFYAERGLAGPACCPACRARRRSERNSPAMRAAEGTTQPADGFGNYGGASASVRKSGRPGIRMYSAVCSSCGRATEVPFEPRGNRPVYCRDCFNARRGR